MEITSHITVSPRNVTYTQRGAALLGIPGRLLCSIENKCGCTLAKTAESKIRERLFALLGAKDENPNVKIVMNIASADADIPNAEQGYRISVTDKTVTLTGFSELGLLYAAVTLCQLMQLERGKVSLPSLEILDSPDCEKRGHLVESRYGTNLMTLSDWKSVVEDLLEKKQNTLTVSLYGCWGMQYDNAVCEYVYFSLDKYPKLKTSVITKYYSPKNKSWIDKCESTPMAQQDTFGELCSYAAAHGVQVIPLVNTYGHNTLIPRMYPQVSAKYPDGSPTNNGFCTAEEQTYRMLFDIMDSIIDRYLLPNGFTAFDIGMDEIDDESGVIGVDPNRPYDACPAFCECEKCRDVPNYTKFINHAVKLIKHLKEKGMTQVYICNDMFFRSFDPKKDAYLTPVIDTAHKGSYESIAERADNYIPFFRQALADNGLLDMTVLNWWKYTDVPERMSFSASDIASSGIKSVVKPMNGYYHWNVLRPSIRNSHILAQYAHEIPDCLGCLSYSNWDSIFDRTNSAQAMFCWNFADACTPEQATRRYCERVFSVASERAIQAFELLDQCNSESLIRDENGRKLLDSRTMMERELAYYRFSYLAKGMPYPRNFPGEGMGYILKTREEHEQLLTAVGAAAEKARDIFLSLASMPGCDRYYALRYALEAENFACLCSDYKALLRMYDLTQVPITSDSAATIEKMAAERKNARLSLMAKMEELQEHYLHSSHLRNQSIFMQLFADIEAYAANTPIQDLRLDFTDLGNIASEKFKALR